MDEILKEFTDDVESIRQSILLLEQLKMLNTIDETSDFEGILNEDKKNILSILTQQTKSCHTYFPVMEGTLVLYVTGRFENYVRTIFEEACIGIAEHCGTYDALPNGMKNNLIKYTAEVISSPRKYNHAEGAVKTFISNLSKNLNENSVTNINFQCLSITNENMRSVTLQELFERCGMKKLWETLSEQAVLKMHFSMTDKNLVAKEARTKLDELMNLRNNIAHPSNGITWIDAKKIEEYIDFLIALSKALKDIVQVHVLASGEGDT